MCVKQISSHFTTKSHKESLAPLRLFCARVAIAPEDVTTFVSRQSVRFELNFELNGTLFESQRKTAKKAQVFLLYFAFFS